MNSEVQPPDIGDPSWLSRLVQILPQIKGRFQLAGLAIVVAAFVTVHAVAPSAVKAQISAGAIGVLFIVFGQVFTALDRFPAAHRAGLIITLFVLFCVFVLSLIVVTSIFIRDDKSPSEQEVSDLYDQIVPVVGAWEGSDENPAYRETVSREAPKLAVAMLSIPDADLRPEWQILKYEYGLYAAAMASSVQPRISKQDQQIKRSFALKGLAASEQALNIISTAEIRYLADSKFKKAEKFIRSDEDKERVRYMRAVCFCLLARTGEPKFRGEAQHEIDEINQVDPHFTKGYPVDKNTEFKDCIQ